MALNWGVGLDGRMGQSHGMLPEGGGCAKPATKESNSRSQGIRHHEVIIKIVWGADSIAIDPCQGTFSHDAKGEMLIVPWISLSNHNMISSAGGSI